MVLDATVREANFKDSIKKLLLDNRGSLVAHGSVPILFDKSFDDPEVRDKTLLKWVVCNLGRPQFGTVSECIVYLLPCTRKDNEGFKLAQLRDRLLGLFFDPSYPNGQKPVPLYDSSTTPWTIIGYMLPYVSYETGGKVERDETKYKSITLTLKWGAKA